MYYHRTPGFFTNWKASILSKPNTCHLKFDYFTLINMITSRLIPENAEKKSYYFFIKTPCQKAPPNPAFCQIRA